MCSMPLICFHNTLEQGVYLATLQRYNGEDVRICAAFLNAALSARQVV